MTEAPKRGGKREGAGRKPTPEADALRVGSIRMTQAQWEKLALLGGAQWLRDRIERAKVPAHAPKDAARVRQQKEKNG